MKIIKAGYKAFNGYTFTSVMAELYNRTCKETERVILLAGVNPSAMATAAIDRARDNQTRMYKSIIKSGDIKEYGLYKLTMNDGFTVSVNASSFKAAFDSVIKARIINAPISAVKSCKLMKRL